MILFLFLGNVRGALLWRITILSHCFFPRSVWIAAHFRELAFPGRAGFGMVVDGAVVMVENIVRHLGRRRRRDDRGACPHRRLRSTAAGLYAIGIIITAYLPIFTLQRVEGRLFKPMAWTVAFALLGALIFSMLIAPAFPASSFERALLPVAESCDGASHVQLSSGKVTWAVRTRWPTVGVAPPLAIGALAIYLAFSGVIGSEFLPHLDEGAIWVRGTLAPSTGPTEGAAVVNKPGEVRARFRKSRGAY